MMKWDWQGKRKETGTCPRCEVWGDVWLIAYNSSGEGFVGESYLFECPKCGCQWPGSYTGTS